MDWISFFSEFILHIDKFLGAAIQAFGLWTYVLLFGIVFVETGIVIFPFLPGDSLLFAAGSLAGIGLLDIWLLFFIFCIAAILGDTVNYWIGSFFGKKLFKEKSVLFSLKNYEKAHRFYEKYGGITIILGRFIPFIRTFVPFVAGAAKMDYKKFITYNVLGGIAWVALFLLLGFLFGNIPIVQENFGLVIIAIIVISCLPAIFGILRHFLKKKN